MSFFLVLAYLFFIGSVLGWVIELFFRRFISSKNPERKWINPGFCVGPYIPLYGFGLCALYGMTYIDELLVPDTTWGFILMIVMMAVTMTAIELIAGLFVLKVSNIRLWDYSDKWGNFMGLICPQFSLIWAGTAVAYYFLLHQKVIGWVSWLSENLAYSFVIGFFFGIFVIDVCYSANVVAKVRKYAVDNNLIVRYEELKTTVHTAESSAKQKVNFLFPFKDAKNSLGDYIDEAKNAAEKQITKVQKHKKPQKNKKK